MARHPHDGSSEGSWKTRDKVRGVERDIWVCRDSNAIDTLALKASSLEDFISLLLFGELLASVFTLTWLRLLTRAQDTTKYSRYSRPWKSVYVPRTTDLVERPLLYALVGSIVLYLNSPAVLTSFSPASTQTSAPTIRLSRLIWVPLDLL